MKYLVFSLFLSLVLVSCQTEILSPPPIDLLTDEIVFKRASDAPSVRVGMYNAFRTIGWPNIKAGDFTADHIQHNGTFTDYQELGAKQITPANGVVGALWGSVFRTVYMANFVLEKLPTVTGMTEADTKRLTAEAKFLRGYANFVGAMAFGGIPQATTTDLAKNRALSRATREAILASVLQDYNDALANLPDASATAAYANKNAARAALARYYLYQKNWAQAESFATLLIASSSYSLVAFSDVVNADYNKEAIFEAGYSLSDYDADLFTLFIDRREVIPSNQVIQALTSREAGARAATITFDFTKQKGTDNGWRLNKYGSRDESNRNVTLFRLGEMYLIRAEARAQQNKITGTAGALADLNILRVRAANGLPTTALKPTTVTTATQAEALSLIEKERVYELAFEGHRWYDLVRTGRAGAVMPAFNANWNVKFELWPVPQSEIQRNPALASSQNPGY